MWDINPFCCTTDTLCFGLMVTSAPSFNWILIEYYLLNINIFSSQDQTIWLSLLRTETVSSSTTITPKLTSTITFAFEFSCYTHNWQWNFPKIELKCSQFSKLWESGKSLKHDICSQKELIFNSSFCIGSGDDVLLGGDLNGDSRTDLLCQKFNGELCFRYNSLIFKDGMLSCYVGFCISVIIITTHQRSCGKIMFSQVCFCLGWGKYLPERGSLIPGPLSG